MWKFITFTTLLLSFPIKGQSNKNQSTKIINNNSPDLNATELVCGETFYHQTATLQHPVIYYQINLDSNLNYPLIKVCHEEDDSMNYNDTNDIPIILNLLKSVGNDEDIIFHDINLADSCDAYGLQINLTDLVESNQYGMYYIAVENTDRLFTINMSCDSPSSNQDDNWIIFAIVVSAVGLSVVLFCTFYWMQIKRLKKYGTQLSNSEQDLDIIVGSKDKSHGAHLEVELGGYGSDSIDNDIQYNDGSFIDLRDEEAHRKRKEEIDEDPVVSVFESVIAQLENNEGLDIYQVLAFRAMDPRSRRMRVKKPFSKFRINLDILYLSSFQRVLYVALIVFSLQVIGITIIFYRQYEDAAPFVCAYDLDEGWKNNMNWIYKLLAFLWAAVITLLIGISQNDIRNSGLAQIIDQIPNRMYCILDIVDIVILHIGLLCNLYTLLVAVVGSYFIIFTTKVEDNAMEMVLNAVALFFMIELDDMLVTKSDYKAVEEGCKAFLREYLKEKEQNLPEINAKERGFRNPRGTISKLVNPKKQCLGIKGMSRMTKCVEYFGYSIAMITVICGLVGPVVILLCYDGFDD